MRGDVRVAVSGSDLDRRLVPVEDRRSQAGVAAVVVSGVRFGCDLRRMCYLLRGNVGIRASGGSRAAADLRDR